MKGLGPTKVNVRGSYNQKDRSDNGWIPNSSRGMTKASCNPKYNSATKIGMSSKAYTPREHATIS